MGGVFIGLFAKRKVLGRIKELYSCQVKAGMGGRTKNKGSCVMRFRVDNTSFAFLSCHLASGDAIKSRTEMIKLILQEAFSKAKTLPRVMAHNCVFLFGDLNFRVSLSNAAAREALREKKIPHLL